MPVPLPPWFVDKYSVNPNSQTVLERPISPREEDKSPYQKELSLLKEPADTQAGREILSPEAQESAERKIDPEILNRLSSPPLTLTPKREFSPFEPGKKVFTDPQQLEQIIAESPEENKIIPFKDAFKKARGLGLKEFEYKGNRFNTRQEGETNSQWFSILNQNKIPQNFADYMNRAGVITAEGKPIDLSRINTKLGPALDKVAPLFKAANITPEITSGQRDWNEWSLHETGDAIDMRLKTADPQSLKKLEDSMPGNPVDTFVEGEKARVWTDGEYQYFIYGSGNKLHLHIERETPDSKRNLIKHMIKKDLRNKIPQNELEQYLNQEQY